MKLLLALATWAPPVILGAFFILIVVASIAGGGDPEGHHLVPEPVLFAMVIVPFVLGGLVLPTYQRHREKNDALHPEAKKRWKFWLRYYAVFAMPIYWRRYLRDAPLPRDES